MLNKSKRSIFALSVFLSVGSIAAPTFAQSGTGSSHAFVNQRRAAGLPDAHAAMWDAYQIFGGEDGSFCASQSNVVVSLSTVYPDPVVPRLPTNVVMQALASFSVKYT